MKPIVLDWFRHALEHRLDINGQKLSAEECELIAKVLQAILTDARRYGR